MPSDYRAGESKRSFSGARPERHPDYSSGRVREIDEKRFLQKKPFEYSKVNLPVPNIFENEIEKLKNEIFKLKDENDELYDNSKEMESRKNEYKEINQMIEKENGRLISENIKLRNNIKESNKMIETQHSEIIKLSTEYNMLFDNYLKLCDKFPEHKKMAETIREMILNEGIVLQK
jgi:flagellar biosynthesis chaperone FliJ